MRSLALATLSALTVLAVTACTDGALTDVNQPDLDPQFQMSAMQSSVQESSVHWLEGSDQPALSKVEGATAQLTRTNSGVAYSFQTNGLEKGHVVTMWWVIFNSPEECSNPMLEGIDCGLMDLGNPDVEPSVMGGDGHLVGKSGKSTHGGHLREGEITNFHPAFEGTPGLLDAMGAEIHLVLRTHGPAIPGMIQEMRSTFEAGCTPESSMGFGDGPNDECADIQAAAFSAP